MNSISTTDYSSSPAAQSFQSATNRISQKTLNLLSEAGVDLDGINTLKISIDDNNEIKVSGAGEKTSEVTAALKGDKELQTLLKQAQAQGGVYNPGYSPNTSSPAQAIKVDTVEISDEARVMAAEQSDVEAIKLQPEEETENEASVPLWADVKKLSKLLGLGEAKDLDNLMLMLENKIEKDTEELQETISSILKENGIYLSDEDKLSFEVDEEGYIHVSGLDNEDKLVKIEEALNAEDALEEGEEPLGMQLRTLQAQENFLVSRKLPSELSEFSEADMKTLIQSYLRENNISEKYLEGGVLNAEDDGDADKLHLDQAFIDEFVKLENVESESSKLTFQNETLVNPNSKAVVNQYIGDLFDKIEIEHVDPNCKTMMDAIDRFNNMTDDDEDMIKEFSFSYDFDHNRITVEAEDEDDAAMIQSWLGEIFTEATRFLSEELRTQHQAEFGDVDEYKHMVEFSVDYQSGIRAEVVSDEADEAMTEQVEEANGRLAEKLHAEMDDAGIDLPYEVDLEISEDGKIRIADSDQRKELVQLDQMLDMVNKTLDLPEEEEPTVLTEEEARAKVGVVAGDEESLDIFNESSEKKFAEITDELKFIGELLRKMHNDDLKTTTFTLTP